MGVISIYYDEKEKIGNVVDVETGCSEFFNWSDNFDITHEEPDSDNEDFNDNARWLMKTILEILKLEKNDPFAHCDWSADYNKNSETGNYLFSCSIKKIKEKK